MLPHEQGSSAAPQVDNAAASWEAQSIRDTWERVQALLAQPAPAWPSVTSGRPAKESGPPTRSMTLARAMSMSADAAQRMRAVELWSATSSGESITGLILALTDPDERVRSAAARAMDHLAQPVLVERVMAVLIEPGTPEAQELIQVLPELREQLETPCLEALENADTPKEQRWVAAYCIGRMGCTNAAPVLMRETVSEDPVLARTAAQALTQLRTTSGVSDWIELTRHADPEVRRMALEALAVTGVPEALRVLDQTARGMLDPDVRLQVVALHAIGGQPREVAVPVLIDIMKQTPRLRHESARLLRELTGVDMGEKPEDWDHWYKMVTGQIPPPLVAASEEPPPPPSEEEKILPKLPPDATVVVPPVEVGTWEDGR